MINNKVRVGNFTSSEIVALTSVGTREMTEKELAEHKRLNPGSRKKNIADGFGESALTYILETNFERRLDRSITDEVSAKPLTWGKLLEAKAFDLLGTEYSITSQETDVHPTISYWAGSKDGLKHDKGKTVVDFKCPMTLKSFCQLVQPLYDALTGMDAMAAIREGYTDSNGREYPKHKDGDKFYWQLVSNAIINDCQFAELIVYMPYESELPDIRMMAQNVEADQMHKHYWIAMSNDGELPFIHVDGYYKNINIIRFEIPESDKKALTDNVLKAGKMLIPYPKRLGAPDPDSIEFEMVSENPVNENDLKV